MAIAQTNIQRAGPPYALIVFATLTVILAACSVWLYLKWDKSQQEVNQLQNRQDRLLSRREAGDKEYKTVQAQALKTKGQPSVVTYLMNQRADLRQTIAADASLSNKDIQTRIDLAIDAAQSSLDPDRPGSLAGLSLVQVLDSLAGAYKSQSQQLTAENDARNAAENSARQAQQAKQALRTATDEYNAKLRVQMQAREEQINRFLEDWKADLKKLDANLDTLQRTRLGEKALAQKRIDEIQNDLTENRRRLETLIGKVQQWRKEGGIDFTAMVTRADGRIVKIIPGQNKVLIDIGQGEHLPLSLQFEVFSSTERISESSRSKATIQVVRLGPKLSECQIVTTAQNQSIMPDDLIVNTIYDRQNKYVFRVIGEFDVYGTGRPDPAGAKTLELLIERWGGKVVPELRVQTDFLVVGLEPYVPPKPDDFDQAALDLYQQRLREHQAYTKSLSRATDLSIPILNHKRFLYLLGLGERSPLEPLYSKH